MNINTSIVAEIAQGKRRNIQFGEYQWRVLDVQGDKALLLTEDVVEKRPRNAQRGTTWEKCALRRYLNNEFYNKFSSQEQTMIVLTENTNISNRWLDAYVGSGGNDTVDKVFLLSIEEVVEYFGKSEQLKNKPSPVSWVDDEFSEKRVATYGNKAWWWWLRSPGVDNYAAFVDSSGAFSVGGINGCSSDGGVRPALWLSLKS
jgi:hypothetical protein